MPYNHQPLPPDEEANAKVRRARLFEALMTGGKAAYNQERDRLFSNPKPKRRIDAHDVGDVLILSRPIPEYAIEPGVYVLCSVLGDDAYLALAGENEDGDLVATDRQATIHRNLLDWFQYSGIKLATDSTP